MFLQTCNQIPYRSAALQINGHDPNRVPSIDRDDEDPILRRRRPDHTTPQSLERGSCGGPIVVGFHPRHRRPRKHAHKNLQTMGCARKIHIYPCWPRLMAVFFCEGPGGRAVLTSRRRARRINSGKLMPSLRAFSSRSCWTSRGSRTVTGTLPFGSFVLGMKPCVLLYHTPVKIEFSCWVIFAVTRSAA